MSAGARLRALLARDECLVTPGVYDAISARIAEDSAPRFAEFVLDRAS